MSIIQKGDIALGAERLSKYIEEIKNLSQTETPLGFLVPLHNTDWFDAIEKQVEKFKGAKTFFIFGIGGSNLATKAIFEALTLHKQNELRVFFIESLDHRLEAEIASHINEKINSAEDFTMIVISKSGRTIETLDSFERVFEFASEKFGSPQNDRVLVISSKNTELHQMSLTRNMTFVEWTGSIGGRFSVFTSAHATISHLLGINVRALLQGGKASLTKYLDTNTKTNPSALLASSIALHYKIGFDILDFFIFNEELLSLGQWVRQLVAESLGKPNKSGEPIGITPTISIGPRDLHSQLELYLGGPKNRFTIFIKSEAELKDTVTDQTYANTVAVYETNDLPFEKYEMASTTETGLAEFMVFMMLTVVYIAKLLDVDAFDQPAVEEYKKSLNQ